MDAPAVQASNIALWREFFEDQSRFWLRLWAQWEDRTLEQIAAAWLDLAAVNTAIFVAAFVAPQVEQAFLENAPHVTAFVGEADAPSDQPVPSDFRRSGDPEPGVRADLGASESDEAPRGVSPNPALPA